MALAYYNENNPHAVAALEQLIREDAIAPGVVDSRSIKEVQAHELRAFTQWHFFAGGGLWSVAARGAGWPDNRPLASASCPCQPFSGAGQQAGFSDPRHLWPDLYRIYSAARDAGFLPPVLVGEQVAGALGYNWFDGVRADLARKSIACRTVDIPACAVDAPHERNRLYWIGMADTLRSGRDASAYAGICGGEESAGSRNGEPQRLHGTHSGLLAQSNSSHGQRADDGSGQGARSPVVGTFHQPRGPGGCGVQVRDGKDSTGMATTGPDGRSRIDQLPRQMIAQAPQRVMVGRRRMDHLSRRQSAAHQTRNSHVG